MNDIAKVCGINGVVLGLINILTLKEWLSCVLVLVTIGYTAWKWQRDYRKPPGKNDDGE